MDRPLLRTARLTLRPLAPQDRDEHLRVHEVSDELWRRWMPLPPADQTPQGRFDRDLAATERGLADGTACRLVAFLPDGRIAGFFTLSQIFRRGFQNAYAGWRVNAEVIGQGLGSEAVAAL